MRITARIRPNPDFAKYMHKMAVANRKKMVFGSGGCPGGKTPYGPCNCCCCGDSCVECITTCSECPLGAPSTWYVTFPGLEDGSCDCSILGGTITLTPHATNPCVWSSEELGTCAGSSVRVSLQNVDNSWKVHATKTPGGAMATYMLSEEEWGSDCATNKTLDFLSESGFGECEEWPSATEVSPGGSGCCVNCTTSCSACSTAPLLWNLEMSGWSSGSFMTVGESSCPCTNLNGTFLLTHQSNCVWTGSTACLDDPVTPILFELSNSGSLWKIKIYEDSGVVVAGNADYILSEGFDCLGMNVLPLSFNSTNCTSPPADVIVEPAGLLGTNCDTLPCCPGTTFPQTLYLWVTQLDSNCTCLNSFETVTMTYNPSTQSWQGQGPLGSCGVDVAYNFFCAPGVGLSMQFTFSNGCADRGMTGNTQDCDGPTYATFDFLTSGVPLFSTCGCSSDSSVRFTLTASPP